VIPDKRILDIAREAARDRLAGAPEWLEPLFLPCPVCERVEQHSLLEAGCGPKIVVCWGCDEAREARG
jgi:hypothetical protein